jgi:hypothetical protein
MFNFRSAELETPNGNKPTLKTDKMSETNAFEEDRKTKNKHDNEVLVYEDKTNCNHTPGRRECEKPSPDFTRKRSHRTRSNSNSSSSPTSKYSFDTNPGIHTKEYKKHASLNKGNCLESVTLSAINTKEITSHFGKTTSLILEDKDNRTSKSANIQSSLHESDTLSLDMCNADVQNSPRTANDFILKSDCVTQQMQRITTDVPFIPQPTYPFPPPNCPSFPLQTKTEQDLKYERAVESFIKHTSEGLSKGGNSNQKRLYYDGSGTRIYHRDDPRYEKPCKKETDGGHSSEPNKRLKLDVFDEREQSTSNLEDHPCARTIDSKTAETYEKDHPPTNVSDKFDNLNVELTSNILSSRSDYKKEPHRRMLDEIGELSNEMNLDELAER